MSTYQEYSRNQVLLRRTAAVTAGIIAFPVMVFTQKEHDFIATCIKSGRKRAINLCGWLAQK